MGGGGGRRGRGVARWKVGEEPKIYVQSYKAQALLTKLQDDKDRAIVEIIIGSIAEVAVNVLILYFNLYTS